MPYFTYILKCADATLYTGITNDLEKRIVAHNTLKTGAKYTRARRPVVLVYSKKCKNKSVALKKECVLKKLSREEKLRLCDGVSRHKSGCPAELEAVAAGGAVDIQNVANKI